MDQNQANPQTRTSLSSPGLRLAAFVIFLTVLLIRVAVIFTGHTLPDGDESLLGLMALHILQGRGHPLYAYGGGYGLGAGFEAHLAALLFYLFGVSPEGLKITGLFIWVCLMLLAWRLARTLFGPRVGYLALSLLAAAPQMVELSMKIRGGHMSAVALLVAAAWSVWRLIITRAKDNSSLREALRGLFCGLLVGLAAWFFPLVLPGCLTIFALALGWAVWQKRVLNLAGLVAGATVIFCLAMLNPLTGYVVPQEKPSGIIVGIKEPVSSLFKLVSYALPRCFTPYPDSTSFPMSAGEILSAGIWLICFIVSLAWALEFLRGARFRSAESRALGYVCLQVLVGLAGCLGIPPRILEARHLFPVYPFYCILLGAFLVHLSYRVPRVARTTVAVLVVTGLWITASRLFTTTYHNAGISYQISLQSPWNTIESLKRHGVRHVFSADSEFMWNLNFLSKEEIVARYHLAEDRYPAYNAAVNRAAQEGQPTAVVFVRPDSILNRGLAEALLKEEHGEVEFIAPDVLIIYQVPAPTIFRYFHLRPPKDNDKDKDKD